MYRNEKNERLLGIRYAVKALESMYDTNRDENQLMETIYGN